jgi:hypothetical protein
MANLTDEQQAIIAALGDLSAPPREQMLVHNLDEARYWLCKLYFLSPGAFPYEVDAVRAGVVQYLRKSGIDTDAAVEAFLQEKEIIIHEAITRKAE